MVQRRNGFGFALKTEALGRVRGKISGQDFDGDGTVQTRVGGKIDFPHSARAYRSVDLIGS